MTCARNLVASIVFLGLGIGLVLGYSHDSTIGLTAAHPVTAASLQVIIHTDGWPAMAGVFLVVLGVLLLFIALVQAVLEELGARQGQASRRVSS